MSALLLLFAVAPLALTGESRALFARVALTGENRAWFARVELVGPLEQVTFACGAGGELVWTGPLVAGEKRIVELPFPLQVPLGSIVLDRVPVPELHLRVHAGAANGGSARWLDWVTPQPVAAIEALPPGLAARPLPPLGETQVRAGAAELILLALALAASRVVRRRPWAVLLVGIVAGLGLAISVGRARGAAGDPAFEPAATRVIEGDLRSGAWCEVRGARDRLVLLEGSGALEVAPAGRDLRLEASGQPGAATVALAPGAALYTRRILAAPTPWLAADANQLADLEDTWVRAGDGSWARCGPWRRGEPFPADGAVLEGTDASPGWLRAGLPPGRPALVGRLGADSWVRVSGFELP